MMIQQGEIYLVEIPLLDGHEQAGFRPALIIQSSDIEKIPTVVIIPFTSQLKAKDFPFTVLIEPDSLNNLDMQSVALIFQIRAIDKKRLTRRIGKIDQERLEIIKTKLKEFIGL